MANNVFAGGYINRMVSKAVLPGADSNGEVLISSIAVLENNLVKMFQEIGTQSISRTKTGNIQPLQKLKPNTKYSIFTSADIDMNAWFRKAEEGGDGGDLVKETIVATQDQQIFTTIGTLPDQENMIVTRGELLQDGEDETPNYYAERLSDYSFRLISDNEVQTLSAGEVVKAATLQP